MPLLVGDIGGTNARFALAGEDLRPTSLGRSPGEAHATFIEALAAYLRRSGARADQAAFAVAGPVAAGRHARVTNRPAWVVDAAEIATRFGFARVVVINDFEAQAASLPHLAAGEIVQIGDARPAPDAPKLAIGPGTGLGVAGLLPEGEGWRPVPGEGGHVDLAAADAREWAAFEALRRDHARIEAETILSGPGLARLHAALHGDAARASPAEIVAAAERGDPLAEETAAFFLAVLARFAGDMALTFKAEGGVYLCGGVAPHMLKLLDAAAFRRAFERKAPHDGLMREIATVVVASPVAGLIGCAAEARRRSSRTD